MFFPPCPQDVELKFRYPMCFMKPDLIPNNT